MSRRVAVCPYGSWGMYFPDQEYDPEAPYVRLIGPAMAYIQQASGPLQKPDSDIDHKITIDYKDLVEHYRPVAEVLREDPMNTIAALGVAAHETAIAYLTAQTGTAATTAGGSASLPSLPKLAVCINDYEPFTFLRDIKANLIGKFVAVRGTVVRVSNVRPLVRVGEFECNKCGALQTIHFVDGKYAPPTRCVTSQCRSRSFELQRGSPNTVTVDWQKIRLQELATDDKTEAGRIPRTIDVELAAHLVDTCLPGDVISIGGIVKVVTTEEGGRNKQNKTMYVLYVDANSVTNLKSRAALTGEGAEVIQYSLKDMYLIQDIANQPHLFRLIVHSICPPIYGHDFVKAGLLLGLVGGRRRYVEDKNRVAVRGDPHILIVGDPGMGKSQMLQAVAAVAPRGVYVCGNTTTSAGLTVSIHRDAVTGDYTLEAGALVLADQGTCCIDEFDKMSSEHQALLEAMEQQSISVAKAGIVCTLPTRTSVIAAANPAGGHYNKSKTVSENLRMGSALLSRFDLIFILVDKPDARMDKFLTEHVIALHGGSRAVKRPLELVDDADGGQRESDGDENDPEYVPLKERLRLRPDEPPIEPVPAHLLRQYISYARQYVHPTLSPAAATVLQDFYLELRTKNRTVDSTPITTRQLESMVRLAEARARVELRETVTAQDARDVVAIMRESLNQTYEDETGFVDYVSRSQHGTGMSKAAQSKRFVAELQRQAEQTYNNLFTYEQLYQIAQDLHLQIPSMSDFIESLNHHGYLLKKGHRVYKVQTASI